MLHRATFLLIAASAPFALADVKFTSPAAGASVAGGTAFTVSWTDSGSSPSLSDLSNYQLFLYAGSNTSPQQIYTIGPGQFSTGSSITVTIPVTKGATATNAYVLGMISTATKGGTVTNFSNRFTLTGMTGTFPAGVTDADIASISGTSGPATVNNVADAAAGAASSGTLAAGLWGTPYEDQTGPTKYAAMPPVPPTAITATNTAPLYPTSSVPIASTPLPLATVISTVTQAQTFSVASHANTQPAASQPSDDMQKFLNRWKD